MDKLQSLYDALSGRYNLGSFDEFQNKIQDPEKRKALYEAASGEFELGDFDSFSMKIEDSFKKKEDGESLSQEDSTGGDDLMGFYDKAYADGFKDFRKKTIENYSKVIKNDPTFAAITDNINAGLKRRYDRLVDSYLYNPSFDRNNPEAIAQANKEIEQQFKEMRKNAFNENEEYKALLDKYDTELKDVITSEYQDRLREEGRAIADVSKEAVFKSMSPIYNPFMNILSSAAKGEGIISAFGDAVVYKIPQAFQAYGLADESQRYNKLSDSLKELEDMDANQPVYLSEKGNYMKVTQKEGVDVPSQTNFGTLMTASEAADVVRGMSDTKLKEISPKLESALEINEFVNKINQTKGITEDMSFGNVMKNIAEQVPNMAVAAVAPVIGTTILEAGNTYIEQLIEISRQENGEEYTTQDVLDIIERGDDGAALAQSSGIISGSLDVIGLGGIASVITAPVRSLGKQILKQGIKEGVKKVGKTKAAEIGLGIVKAGFWEGITEGLQGANMQFSKIESVERATDVRLDFDWKPVWEEALMGGVMGGVFGGVGTTFNVLTNNNVTGLPEDDITLAAVSEERTYFDGADAITRKQAVERVKRANSLQELEKIRVKNDDQIAAAIEEKRLQFPIEPVEEAEQTKPDTDETTIAEGNRLFNEPLQEASTIADRFTQRKGFDSAGIEQAPKLEVEKAQRIAKAFDELQPAPQDEAVMRAYNALAEETLEQYQEILADGYRVEINNDEPYASSADMIRDLKENKRMKIFSTESGFGDEAITDEQRASNPLLKDSGLTDANGQPLLVNDVFRFVHDFFGHAKLGNGFGPKGEEVAWFVHSKMYSDDARRALTTETRGQNSWVNFSGVNDEAFQARDKAREIRQQAQAETDTQKKIALLEEAGRLVDEAYNKMSFAEQKIGLLPDEFVFEEPTRIVEQAETAEESSVVKEVAPEEVVAEDKPTEDLFEGREGIRYDMTPYRNVFNQAASDTSNIPFRTVKGKKYLAWTYKDKGKNPLSATYKDDKWTISINKSLNEDTWIPYIEYKTPQGELLDLGRDFTGEFTGNSFAEVNRVMDDLIELIGNPEYFNNQRLVDSISIPKTKEAQPTPVANKTPEMEELEEEIAQLQSDIEIYEIRAEDLQEEIDIEKGNLKEELAAINDRIKEVRASKKPAATKREEIEELQAEKEDVRDDNAGLIEGYKEEIKDAKREAKKAANRTKRLTAKLEVIKPAEPAAQESTKESNLTMKDVSFEDDIKDIVKSGRPGKEVFNYTEIYTEFGQKHFAYRNEDRGLTIVIRNVHGFFAYRIRQELSRKEIDPADTTTPRALIAEEDNVFDTRKSAEQEVLRLLRNPEEFYKKDRIQYPQSKTAEAFINYKSAEPVAEPVTEEKKVVGTIEIEDVEEKVSVKAELKAATSVGFTLIEEKDASGKEMIEDALDKYNAQLNIVIDESNPLSRISNDDTAADKKAFEQQNPKLKNVVKMLRAMTKFKGLSQFHNMPIRVIVYEKMSDMDTVLDFIDDADEFTNGFFDADSNTVFIGLDATAENVLAHEFVHPIVQRIIYSNPQLMRELAAEAKQNKAIQDFIKQYKIEQRNEEAVVQYVSLAVQKHIDAGRTLPQKIRDFFMRILDKLGINKGVVFDDVKQLDDLIRLVTEGFVSGRIFQDKALMAISEVKVFGENIAQIKLSERPELGEVKRIDAKQLDKKRVVATLYDNLKTGDVTWTNPVTRKQYVFEGKKGGPLHMFLKENLKNNVVAAFTRLAVARKFAARAKDSDALVYTLMSTDSSLEANRDVFKDIFGVVVADIEDFMTFKKDLSNILNTVGTQQFKEDLMGINNAQQLTSYLDDLTFAKRRAIFKKVFPKVVGTPQQRIMQSKYGMPTSGEIVNIFSEETMNNAKSGDTFAASKIRPVILVNEKEFKRISKATLTKAKNEGIEIKQMPKESEHASYPYAIEGEPIGLFNKFVNVRDMLPYVPKDATTWIKYVEGNGSIDTVSQIIEDESVRLLTEEGTEEARISAAPIRSFKQWFQNKFKGKTPTVEDIKKVQNTKEFKSYRKKYLDSARLFNLTPGNIFNNAGVFVGDVEYSNSITVQGDMADMRALAAFMGLTEGPQESVVISRPNPQGNGRAIDIFYDNPKKSTKGADELVALGIDGMSYSFEENKITIYVDETNDQKVTEIIEKYYDESKVKAIEYTRADVEFVEESSYRQILESYRSEGRNLGEGKRPLRNAIDEALGESPLNPFGNAPSRMKQSKSNRQNVINPAKVTQERFSKKLTPKRIGSTYAVDLEILTTIDIEELANLADMSGANVGINLLKEYNKVVGDLADVTMPGARDLEPARVLANKIREALDFSTQEKIVEYAYLLLAMTDGDPSGITSDKEVIDLIKQGLEEGGDFTLSELEADEQIEFEQFIVNNIGEIRKYASDVHFANLRSTKFSDRMKGTKYENREALLKNDIVRTATKILIEQRDALAEMGTPASVDQLGLSDFHAETIAETLGGGDNLANLLRTNLKSLTNIAQNDLRNQNIVSGIVEISRRFNTRGIPQKFLKGKLFADQNVVDKILSIVKNGFTADEIKVLEDYMEYHENRKILKTIQSIQHGYMPPMAYGIINKFIQATEAIKLAGNIDNMTVMLDANGRIIRDAVAAREAKELTELADQIAPETLSKRTTTAAISAFDKVRDKAVTKVYNVVDSALQKVESIREVMINNLNNKFALIKPIARFEGKQYTNMDVSMLGHMYMIEKQFLANPGNPKVPKLKENLIDSITDKTSEENRRYIELYNDFKKDNGVLDIRKTERFLRDMNALNDATQESGMAFINYYRKISQDMQFRIKFIQEFQRKTKVELFDEYVFVATKGKGGSVEAKADLIENMLRMDASGRWTGGIAKTSISRRNYISANKTFVKFTDREPVFDLMFSANYMLNEGLSSYHVGEAYRDAVSRLNILSKMGDNATSALAQAMRNDITARVRNAVEYKLDRSKGVVDSAVMKLLGGTYRAYLASVNRVVELLTNSVYVGISDPAIAKEIIRNSKDTFLSNQTADETQAIMNKTGSVHIARFNKVGKSFYSAEGIGTERLKGQAPSIWDGLGLKKKDGEYRELYVAYKDAINRVGVLSTGLKDWTDAWVRMSDTRIASISWNTLFKGRFKEITGVDFDSAMLEDQDLFLRYRLAMKQASNHADVFISEGFSGSSFAMNQNALKNKGTVKYIENMFRTFRTFRYETTRNAIRSLIGLKDGTMSKDEAARKLTAVLVSELMYSLGTQVAVTKLFELVAVAMGAEMPDDEEDEFKNSFQLALGQLASTMMFGRLSAIRFGLLAGTTKAVVRNTQGDDLSILEGLKSHLQRMKLTNYFMRQTVPILGDPTNVTLDATISLIDVLDGEAPKEDLLIDAFKMIAVYRGVPFTGDIAKIYRAMNQDEPKKKKKGKYKSSL